MHPSQGDYGRAGDEALVPGTLRVYRSFLVDAKSGHLTPMNYHPQQLRYVHARGQMPYHPFRNRSTDPSSPYEATCTRSPMGRAMVGEHETPDVNCTCGFYASYNQFTDFYPAFRWGRNYTRMAGDSDFEDYYVVRAVCEVSGRVVMGSKGVRAGRMKIVAIAVDWAKYMKAPEIRYEEYYSDDIYSFDKDDPFLSFVPRRRVVERESDDRGYVYDSAPRVADAYGVPLYTDQLKMYEDYPPQDVSHLVDTSKPERPVDDYTFTLPPGSVHGYARGSVIDPRMYNRQAASQAALYASSTAGLHQFRRAVQGTAASLADTVRSAGKAMAGISADFVILDEVETARERALRLKKNRPAPPGTGIDRRRGKLR